MMYQKLITSIVSSIFKAKYIIMLHKGPCNVKEGVGGTNNQRIIFQSHRVSETSV